VNNAKIYIPQTLIINMAKNDDYNPENDPKYAVDKSMADRAYWEMKARKHGKMVRDKVNDSMKIMPPISRAEREHRRDFNFVRDVDEAEIDVGDLGADYKEKDRLLRLHYGIDTRNLTRVQVGRICKQNYTRGSARNITEGERSEDERVHYGPFEF